MSQSNETKRFIVVCLFVVIVVATFVTQRFASAAAPEPEGADADASAAQEGATAAAKDDDKEKKKGPRKGKSAWGGSLELSKGCISCHTNYDYPEKKPSADAQTPPDTRSMHYPGQADNIGCVSCHQGDETVVWASGMDLDDTAIKAHVARPTVPDLWEKDGKKGTRTTANPVRLSAEMNKENLDWIQFVNPGDLRVAHRACGTCHDKAVNYVDTSMMKHGGMLWGAALYNNGAHVRKDYRYGESYNGAGQPERIYPTTAKGERGKEPTKEEMLLAGKMPYLEPLPRYNITQPGNVLRVFEHGEDRLSLRGFGTLNRTDPVFLGLQKTRLLDPTLNFLGTNDQPGDYRSSGCSACHVVYANDRWRAHSGGLGAAFTNQGTTKSTDPMIIKEAGGANEPGHPINHIMQNSIPSSQCMVCHMHPGTNMITPYYGVIWWDNETDGTKMYPEKTRVLNAEEVQNLSDRNPEESAQKGLWGDLDFLSKLGTQEFNSQLTQTQFADFHGHGWVYRAVFKMDKRGNYLDHGGSPVSNINGTVLWNALQPENAGKEGVPVHMKDIHTEKGMHCVDCHFEGDAHGNGNLYVETRNAVEIDCIDCHGTITEVAKLATSGPAKEKASGRNLAGTVKYRDVDGKEKAAFVKVKGEDAKNGIRKENRGGKDVLVKDHLDPNGTKIGDEILEPDDVIQYAKLEPNRWWRVIQTRATLVEGHRDYRPKSAYAKTVTRSGQWGGEGQYLKAAETDDKLAHADRNMTCMACHSAWTTSCFGCHLPMRAPKRAASLHYDFESKNYTNYNFQTLRDDVYMLGRDGTVTGNRIAPVRSSCAVLVGSQSANREWFYSQQQTISVEGYAGTAFSTYTPHTVRGRGETKECEDCHVSTKDNNNATMAHITVQGANVANFVGRYAFVAVGDGGIEAIEVTERPEPQAVYGSDLHKLAFPEAYKDFIEDGSKLSDSYSHRANGEALSLQMRGEYLYVANGDGGMRIYDISRIDDKLFSERIATSIVSPIGQRLSIKSKYAAAVASPTTLGVDPTRQHFPENQEANYRPSTDWAQYMRYGPRKEGDPIPKALDPQPIHLIYGFLYVADKEEGLIVTGAATLLDGNPENNFLKRVKFPDGNDAFNPGGALDGARNITIVGTYAYISAAKGLVVVDLNDPTNPKLVKTLDIRDPRDVEFQFRYGFVTCGDGLKVIDITNIEDPKVIESATQRLTDARSLFISRTWVFVGAGPQGLAIFDIERPEAPRALPFYTAEGKISDTYDVTVGMTNNSIFAYVADGKNGFHIVQLMSAVTTMGSYGYAPPLDPKLIATKKTRGPALAVSEGLDRDRAVDESGNQLAVFGRRGARPFNQAEMRRLYIDPSGSLYKVSNDPPADKRVAANGEPISPASAVGQAAPADAAGEGTSTAVSVVYTGLHLMPLLIPMGLLLLPIGRRRLARLKKK